MGVCCCSSKNKRRVGDEYAIPDSEHTAQDQKIADLANNRDTNTNNYFYDILNRDEEEEKEDNDKIMNPVEMKKFQKYQQEQSYQASPIAMQPQMEYSIPLDQESDDEKSYELDYISMFDPVQVE